ncbi:asparagine synthetase A [Cuniculiplasma sp. SKW3]|uniref:asparagine synthetase A n=1 Tax=Cuniculiplasma sp. SKW3 TaxID=3400170 RepID=UPI003FD14FB7
METEIVSSTIERLKSEKLRYALEVNTSVRRILAETLIKKGFLEAPPVIFSVVTDPLNHPVYDPSFLYGDFKYSLTKSMIFHKQILVQEIPKFFIFSPNVRLETPDKASSGRHLLEFTQLDLEIKGAHREELMDLGEDLVIETFKYVKEKNRETLEKLGRKLDVPKKPFKSFKYLDLLRDYGEDFEALKSKEEKEPFWIIDIPLDKREFYDREKDDEPGILRDMDLIYPEGFGEALSGGEREYEIERIRERIIKKGQTFEQFHWFLEVAQGGLELSTGFGIGIERLVRYICGFKRIEDVHPFPKIPGKLSL